MTRADRIRALLAQGKSVRQVMDELGTHTPTIQRAVYHYRAGLVVPRRRRESSQEQREAMALHIAVDAHAYVEAFEAALERCARRWDQSAPPLRPLPPGAGPAFHSPSVKPARK